ncbi:MAG: hypothetical protein JRM85_09260 [Nitrososphaerota archaeon]|nr:hypothetical protein [Nitrososphaerota archaeon]
MPINRSKVVLFMGEKNRPKCGFSKKLGGGDFFNVAVWPGRPNPQDEVVSVQLRRLDGDWRTLGRLALYRTKEGPSSRSTCRNRAEPRE